MDDSWFDQRPEAAEPTDAVDFDFSDMEGVRRRSRWPLWAATAAAVGAGAALGWYLAFGMPGSKSNNNTPTAAAAQPAAAPATATTPAPIAAPATAAQPPAAEAAPAATEPVAVAEPAAEATAEPVVEPAAAATAEPALPVMTRAHFESDPPGATVTLIDDGRPLLLGPTPVDQSLDPGHTYQAVFTVKGQPAVMVPVEPSGARMTVRAKMNGKGAGAAVTTTEPAAEPAAEPATAPAPAPRARAQKEPVKSVARREPKKDKPKATAGGSGTLMLNAKPPCDVMVDGRKVGSTPQPNISLSAGKHKVTLVNSTYGIKTSFSVTIKAGEKTRVVKDLSDRIK